MSSTTAHLQKITGLKEDRAKECFHAFGSYPAALASFAQSFSSIPIDFFEDAKVALTNTNKINDELRVIFRKARELKAKSGKSDAEVWKMFSAEQEALSVTATPTIQSSVLGEAPATQKSIFSSPSAANPLSTGSSAAFPSSFPTAAGAPVFGFGTSAPKSTPTTQSSVLGEAPATQKSIFSSPSAVTPSTAGASTFGFGAAASTKTTPTPSAKQVFGLGNVATTTPTSALSEAVPVSFGFGKTAETSVTTATGPAVSSFGSTVEAATADQASEKKPVKYCEPTHFTGPYFDMPLFWQLEVVERAPLLNLNNGFLEAHKEELRPRLEKWVAKAAFYRKPVQYVQIEDEDEDVVRVIIKDADRTFFHPDHRRKMVAFLNAMYHEFHAYGQAMSYLAGLCMLVLTEVETAAVIRFVATEYLKGHWAAEAVGFATSAWVVEYFMQKKQPEVAKHLAMLNFWPDTYLQKILTGLCIHVLQFNELFSFLDAFMQGGMRFLIRFCLAIVEHFRTELLAIKDSTEANELYELMRLDHRVADHEDVLAILQRAPSIDLGEDGDSIDLIRSQVYEKRIAPRLQRAPRTETFEPCEICDKQRPKWWNEGLGAVCDDCKAIHPGIEFEKY
ncbi:putative Rab-GTPase-TBC domain containing protein [Leishmania shawi]|uniref:Rab-GTPase-TBC domain containing protein n=1 Tax=Leishmania shawi TaxID=5680 RepID=A0AAW3B5J1_9TRYP